MAIIARGDCATNPDWQPTIDAWVKADTDNNLRAWWEKVSSVDGHTSFANELAKGYGDAPTGFECGIEVSGCSVSGCARKFHLCLDPLPSRGS
jgi:hypothetical protein